MWSPALMSLLDIFFHFIFTLNLATCLFLISVSLAKKSFPGDPKHQQYLILLALVIVLTKIFYVTCFYWLFYPEWGMVNDALAYYNMIKTVVDEPVKSIVGFASGHSRGLPAIYGLIFYFHQIYSVYAVLALNVFVGTLTCLAAFLLTRTLTDDKVLPFIAMLFTAIYPECFFWNARLYKENLIILLMPLMAYFGILYFNTRRLKYLFYTLLVAFFLFTVRIYFILELFLILFYFGFFLIRRKPVWMFILLVSVSIALYFLFRENNIIVRILTWKNPELRSLETINRELISDLFFKNARYVFSAIAGGKFGSFGVFLIPFFLSATTLFVITIIKLKAIFKNHALNTGLNLFIISCFYSSLIFADYAGIRYRACVSVLLVCLITVTGGYFWNALSLPRLVLYPNPHKTLSVGAGQSLEV